MAVKTMVFIDGNWLYKSRSAVFAKLNEPNGFEIDYRKLPSVMCEDVANYLNLDVDNVRTVYFGTIPSQRSGFNTGKQNSFYNFLETSCGYETNIHEVDINGSEPRNDESWVVAALSSSLLYYAAVGAYDIAVVLGQDENYAPALRHARLLGKRIQIVGAQTAPDGKGDSAQSQLLAKPKVADFPPIFIENHAEAIRLVREAQMRTCRECGSMEETTWAGPEFFCSKCRSRHRPAEQED